MSNNIRYRVLGVMSGTSLDGMDLAICNFYKNKSWKFNITKSITIPYNQYWRNTLQNLHKKDIKEIQDINKKYHYKY